MIMNKNLILYQKQVKYSLFYRHLHNRVSSIHEKRSLVNNYELICRILFSNKI